MKRSDLIIQVKRFEHKELSVDESAQLLRTMFHKLDNLDRLISELEKVNPDNEKVIILRRALDF